MHRIKLEFQTDTKLDLNTRKVNVVSIMCRSYVHVDSMKAVWGIMLLLWSFCGRTDMKIVR